MEMPGPGEFVIVPRIVHVKWGLRLNVTNTGLPTQDETETT